MFRWLLRLLPPDLRRSWGEEMEALYRARLEEAPTPFDRWRVRLGSLVDLGVQAVAMRSRGVGAAAAVELRDALRSLRHAPGFSLAVILTLTLGVGAPAAVFSVLNGVLLRTLPYRHADELALVTSLSRDRIARARGELPPGVTGLAGFSIFGGTARSAREEPSRVRVMPVTGSFFEVLGVTPVAGRALMPADDRADGPTVAVVSHRYWTTEHGPPRRPAGETLDLDGRSFEIVGVMPPGFTFYWYDDVDLWIPASTRAGEGPSRLSALARLASGIGPEDARGLLTPGASAEASTVRVRMLREAMVGDIRGPLWVFFAASGLVLAVAVGNATNLILGRVLRRRDEIEVRRALGAGRGRVVRQLLAECGLLAAVASVAGLAVGVWSTRTLLAIAPGYVRQAHTVGLDLRVATFAVAVGALATLGAGLLPGWLVTRRPTRVGRRGVGGARAVRTLESGLVAAQLAVTLLLLSSGGVLLRTFLELRPTAPGFRVEGLTVVGIELPRHRVAGVDEVRALTAELVDGLRGLPGVETGEAVTYLPLTGISAYRPASAGPSGTGGPEGEVHHRSVTAGYLDLMEMTLVAGRSDPGPGEVVVNERAAERFWPGEGPLGRTLHLDAGFGTAAFSVVGVVRDARIFGGTTGSSPEAFTSLHGTPSPAFQVVLDAPRGVRPEAVRAAVRAVDPAVPVVRVEPLRSVIAAANRVPRFQVTLVGALAAVALVLSALGTFAVFSHVASRRRREIGVRIAVGAGRRDVAGLVLVRGARVIGIGLAAGWVLSVLAGDVLERTLFGARPSEAPLLLVAAVILALSGAAALALPALRAMAVDPRRILSED